MFNRKHLMRLQNELNYIKEQSLELKKNNLIIRQDNANMITYIAIANDYIKLRERASSINIDINNGPSYQEYMTNLIQENNVNHDIITVHNFEEYLNLMNERTMFKHSKKEIKKLWK